MSEKGVALKTVNPVVFDDQVSCEDGNKKCSFLDRGEWMCSLFPDVPSLEKNTMLRWFKKCQQCKDHYQKNKNG